MIEKLDPSVAQSFNPLFIVEKLNEVIEVVDMIAENLEIEIVKEGVEDERA